MRKNNKIIRMLFILFILFMFTSCKEKDEYDMHESQKQLRELAKEDGVIARLRGIKWSIEEYYKKHQKHPENLDILVNENFLDIDIDAWGNKIIYEPIKNKKGNITSYRLYSIGRDGIGETKDDIYSPEK